MAAKQGGLLHDILSSQSPGSTLSITGPSALAIRQNAAQRAQCQEYLDGLSPHALHFHFMIRTFKSRALSALWHRSDASGIRPDLVARIKLRLDVLNSAKQPEVMNVSGFNFHRLRGKPTRYTIHVNGPWCITFEWNGEDAVQVDLEQYH